MAEPEYDFGSDELRCFLSEHVTYKNERSSTRPKRFIGFSAYTLDGCFGVDQCPRFHHYVVEEHRPSCRYEGDVRVGAVLPEAGVTYYEVPPEYGVREYRYTVVNDRPVLVDPRTRRIVEVVE
jgi:hypothetical protein